MKKNLAAVILYHNFLSLIAYLSTGLMVLSILDAPIDSAYYAAWGIVAGIIVGIKEYFSNKAANIGIGIYAAVMVLWFAAYTGENGRIYAVMAVAGLLAMFIYNRLFHFKMVKILYGYGVLAALICLEFADISFSKEIIAMAIVLFLDAVSDTLSLFYHGNVNSLLIIYVLIGLAVMYTPAPKEPYDWRFVVKAVNAIDKWVGEIVQEISYQWAFYEGDGVFHYGFTGYSESQSPFYMNLGSRDVVLLTVRGDKTKRNFYLKGNVCAGYTKEGWEADVKERTLDNSLDALITLYAIFSQVQDKKELQNFMEVRGQEVILGNMKTQSLFIPLKLLDITEPGAQYEGDNLRAGKTNARNHTYSYQFVDLDYANPELIRIITESKNIVYNEELYELVFRKMREYYDIELEKPSFQTFLEEKAEGEGAVEEKYTALGDISKAALGDAAEKIAGLAGEITKGCSNNYEKCKALENYLYQYHYNKWPNMPEDVDALEWFLFEGKEGYCVHFATALAVMLRCEGIPARVAEGFLVDYREKVDYNDFPVSSDAAHMWVEAYIEGFGWIRLEPTVANAVNANTVWYRETLLDGAGQSGSEGEPEQDGLLEQPEQEEQSEQEDIGKEDMKTEPDQDEESGNVWALMLVMLGVMAVMAGIAAMAFLVWRRNYIRKSNDPDVIFMHLLGLLEKKFMPRRDGDTIREYIEKLSGSRRNGESGMAEEDIWQEFEEVLNLMEGYWYGGRMPDGNRIKEMKEFREKVSCYLKNE